MQVRPATVRLHRCPSASASGRAAMVQQAAATMGSACVEGLRAAPGGDELDTAGRHPVEKRRIVLDEYERRRIPQHGLFDQLARVDVDEVQGLVQDQEIGGCRDRSGELDLLVSSSPTSSNRPISASHRRKGPATSLAASNAFRKPGQGGSGGWDDHADATVARTPHRSVRLRPRNPELDYSLNRSECEPVRTSRNSLPATR